MVRPIGGPMADGRLDLVCYDLDGTLIDGTAFLLVARHFGFEEEVLHHDKRFRSGEITLEECFEIEFAFLAGRTVDEVREALRQGTWFPGIRPAVTMLKEAGLRVAVLTDNPDFITAHLADAYGIEDQIASHGVVRDNVVTGEVRPLFDKWRNLHAFLQREDIDPQRVAHIGNDINDTGVWKNIGLGVAVEPTGPAVRDAADLVFERIDDHRDIADTVLDWHRGLIET